MLHAPTPMFSELAAKCAKDEIARQTSVIATVIENHNSFARLLNEVAAEFERTGIGRPPAENWYWCGYREAGRFNWNAYINRLSKALKRPYVFRGRYNTGLTIEKKTYTRPLYAHLLLIAVEKKCSDPWSKVSGAPVYYVQTGSRITFTFCGGGEHLLVDWFKQAETDPEFRKALRLPER
jgi:hypothetical protein